MWKASRRGSPSIIEKRYMMSKNKELETLLPEGEITINGEKIVIRPFSFAKLPKVIDILSRLGVSVFQLFQQAEVDGNLVINDALLEKISVIAEDNFPDVAALMGIYCNKPVEYFTDEESGLNGEDGLVLLLTIIERNYSFFTKRLAPILEQLKKKTMENQGKQAGKK